MASKPLFPLEAFDIPGGVTHVCTAGQSPSLKSHQRAFAEFSNAKSRGHKGRAEHEKKVHDTRQLLANSWNAKKDEIGFVSSVATGISMLIESIEWRDGDNICVTPDEFPSIVAPVVIREKCHAKEFSKDGVTGDVNVRNYPELRYITPETLHQVVNSHTRIIAVSHVSFLDGSRVDLAKFREVADSVGALLIVDLTQSAGYAPIDASIADFAFAASFKFLLGTTGSATAYWNMTRQPNWKPATAGGYSLLNLGNRQNWADSDSINAREDALCFSPGTPAHLSIYLLNEGARFLSQWDPQVIEAHVLSLTKALLERLQCEGIPVMTPKANGDHGANVCIETTNANEIVDQLYEVGVYAYGGLDRVRFTFHGFNAIYDVDKIMEVFPTLWRQFHV